MLGSPRTWRPRPSASSRSSRRGAATSSPDQACLPPENIEASGAPPRGGARTRLRSLTGVCDMHPILALGGARGRPPVLLSSLTPALASPDLVSIATTALSATARPMTRRPSSTPLRGAGVRRHVYVPRARTGSRDHRVGEHRPVRPGGGAWPADCDSLPSILYAQTTSRVHARCGCVPTRDRHHPRRVPTTSPAGPLSSLRALGAPSATALRYPWTGSHRWKSNVVGSHRERLHRRTRNVACGHGQLGRAALSNIESGTWAPCRAGSSRGRFLLARTISSG